jgi:hypothetical protein
MHAIRTAIACAALGALVLVSAAPAMAGAQIAYRGVFAGPVVYTPYAGRADECQGPVDVIATGTWKVIIHDNMATLDVNIWRDGRHHVSFGATLPVAGAPTGELIAPVTTQMGTLHVGLAGNTFSYWLEDYLNPYAEPALACDSVLYPGYLTRGGTD